MCGSALAHSDLLRKLIFLIDGHVSCDVWSGSQAHGQQRADGIDLPSLVEELVDLAAQYRVGSLADQLIARLACQLERDEDEERSDRLSQVPGVLNPHFDL